MVPVSSYLGICRLAIVASSLLIISACANREPATLPPPSDDPPERISLVGILAAPERYDGRRITTAGLIMIGFEEDILYLSREDAKFGVMLNGIRLEFSGSVKREFTEVMNGKYVIVEGRFRFNRPLSNIMDVTPGALFEITDMISEDDWGRREEGR